MIEACSHVGVAVSSRTRVEDLSLGQRQRVEIARAIITDARFLILDEPTSVLTPLERESFFRLLRALVDGGVGVVLVTHHIDEALEHSDRVTVLRAGRVWESQVRRRTRWIVGR